MDIEKSSGHRKAQMLAALRAEKQRHAAKANYRRRRFTEALERHLAKEAEVLRQKHDVPSRCSPSHARIDCNVFLAVQCSVGLISGRSSPAEVPIGPEARNAVDWIFRWIHAVTIYSP